MEFSELEAKDTFHAFISFVSVKDAKESGLIPKDYHDVFSDRCVEKCGSERIIRRSLSEVRCCNPRCPVKLSYYLARVVTKLGVKGIGFEICNSVMMENYTETGINSHIKLLANPDKISTVSLGVNGDYLFSRAMSLLKQREYTYAEMVSFLCIPTLDATSMKAFGDITSSAVLMEMINKYGGFQQFMASKGIYDPMVLYYFAEFVPDVYAYETSNSQNIIKPSMQNVRVVTTGSLTYNGVSVKTALFIEACNKVGFMPDGTRLFSIEDCEAIESVDYVICLPDATTSKSNIARRREAQTGRKIRYTCEEFVEILARVRNSYIGGDKDGRSKEAGGSGDGSDSESEEGTRDTGS